MTSDEVQVRTDAVRALDAEFGVLITHMRRLIADNAQRVSEGMLPGAYKVFTTIARRERVSQSALADILMVDKGQLSRTVRELEQLGLIRRDADPTDGRAMILSATEFGLERLKRARLPQEDTLVGALEQWPLDDIRTLTRLLHTLTADTKLPG